MFVAILQNAVAADARPDERDVLVQVQAVREALSALGHGVVVVPCTLNLQALRQELERLRPDAAFNLVESLGGRDRLAPFVPALLAELGVPCTGATAESLALTNHKPLAKRLLRLAGLPTPLWVTAEPAEEELTRPNERGTYILKAVGEHASLGIDDESVVSGLDSAALLERISEREKRLGRPCFAEAFIDGREFNLSVLAGAVLPPAEIDFSAFPPGQPRIVGYRAKWDETAREYSATPRMFESAAADTPLRQELCRLAEAAWGLFGLRGYARIDFRVDERQRPWILEINANPCLSPDAGFQAALARAGIPFAQAVQRILEDARR